MRKAGIGADAAKIPISECVSWTAACSVAAKERVRQQPWWSSGSKPHPVPHVVLEKLPVGGQHGQGEDARGEAAAPVAPVWALVLLGRS